MSPEMLLELVGYFASLLVLVSLLMTSVVKLRVINMVGSLIFAIYALCIGSLPTAVMNFCLVGINIWNLIKLRQKDQRYELVDEVQGNGLLDYLLSYYREDIKKYFPAFPEDAGMDRAYIVCCSGNPAGVLLGTDGGPGILRVSLDYSTPTYRDCSIGAYLYAKLPSRGIHTLVFTGDGSQEHTAYLTKMGFAKENGVYIKHLD